MIQPFTSDHETFRKTVTQWVQKELAPHALAWDEAGEFPKNVFSKAADLGLLGIGRAPTYGGSGLDYWYVVAMVEALARANNSGVSMALMVQAEIATPIIDELGSDEQKTVFLAPAIKGEKIAALGISEPGCGSDVAGITTTARRDGDDLVINGSKMWITNGTRADFITLSVRTGDAGHKGISLVTFPTDVAGYTVGKKLKKVGNLSSDTAILHFDNCRIPARYILGKENHGFYYIMANFQSERLIAALSATSTMDVMLQDTMRYGQDRTAFAQPIGSFQVWRHRFVDHLSHLEAAKCLTYKACALYNDYSQRKSTYMPVREISMAKLVACDLAQKVAYDCQQVFGGMGYVTETPVSRAWRDLRLLTIGGGTSEVMKEIIAKLTPGL